MDEANEPSFTEAEMRRVLARAAELDAAREETVSVTTLRAIGAEAGIDPASLDAAVRQHQASAQQGPPLSWLSALDASRSLPAPRYKLAAWFVRAAERLTWQRACLLALPITFVYWQRPGVPAPSAVLIGFTAAQFLWCAVTLFRWWAPTYRSRVIVAVAGACAATPVAVMAFAYLVMWVNADPKLFAHVSQHWWQAPLLVLVLGVIGAQCAVTREVHVQES